jgi:hypothetical protein
MFVRIRRPGGLGLGPCPSHLFGNQLKTKRIYECRCDERKTKI